MKKFYKIMGIAFLALLPVFLIGGFLVYVIWNANAPSSIGISLPPGTHILQQTDTHEGLFRTSGTAVVVAQIPPEHIDDFASKLIGRESYLSFGGLGEHTRKRFEGIENIEPLLESTNVLLFYRDETIIFVDEPWSDYFTAAFDLNTGLLCCVEFDC